jgi:ATP-dependent HslUV protease ATP-binding subunit HslU
VESIVRDLVDRAVKLYREQELQKVQSRALEQAEERVLDALLPPARINNEEVNKESSTRQIFRKKLREGALDDKEIEINLAAPSIGVEIMAPPGMEDMSKQLQSMFSNLPQGKTHKARLTVAKALKKITDEESTKLINDEEIKALAIEAAEQNGIVFIDEIDKVAKREGTTGADVSREGVQRDLLPLIEGCTVSTRHGTIKTDHILFITSGAFHLSKPSDLIPELQGRLPIRVEMEALSPEDFERILVEPDASLTVQYKALMAAEGVQLEFTSDGIRRIAETAYDVNESTENIGARRLHTVLEKLLEDISFMEDEDSKHVVIDAAFVEKQLGDLARDEDLSRFIL